MLAFHRRVRNDALAERIATYRETGKGVSYGEQSREFLARRRECPDTLGMLNASSLQHTLRAVDKSFSAFFRRVKSGTEKPGFPRFKGEDRFDSFSFTYGDGVKLRETAAGKKRLYVRGVGDLRLCWHRDLPEGAVVKHVVLKRSGDRWHASLMCDVPDAVPALPGGPAVGLDFGLSSLIAKSDGTLVPHPACLGNSLAELRVLQRAVARKKRGSKSRAKAKARVAKLQERIADRRRDYLHKMSRQLITDYGFIAIEDLSLAFMNRDRRFSRSSHDAGLGMLTVFLAYKAEDAGTRLVAVDPAWTSQDCSRCRARVPKPLSQRVHRCPHCGLVLDRDVNAARNILLKALKQTPGHGVREPTWAEARPCVSREAVAP